MITMDFPPIEGGISSISFHLAENLTKKNTQITVLAPNFPGIESWDRERKYPVIRFPGYRWGYGRFFPFSLTALKHTLKDNSSLVLGMNVAYGGTVGMLLHQWIKRPYAVVTYAYEFLKFSPLSWGNLLITQVLKQASLILTISSYSRSALISQGIPDSKIHIFPLGVDTSLFFPSSPDPELVSNLGIEDKKVILSIGRLIERKGFDKLIMSMPYILKKFPDAVLLIIGRGPEEERLIKLRDEMGLGEKVKFLGKIEHSSLPKFYNLCDVFVLPNRKGKKKGDVEGFGLVFIEANACGKPVVGGNSGGTVDAIVEGETGFLVNSLEEKEIASKVITLLKDEKLAREMGKKGRERVEKKFNWPYSSEIVKEALGKILV